MPKKILVIEDVPDISQALKILIEMRGFTALTATRGFEALRVAKEHLPELVLLDLSIPDLPGEDVLSELRADPAFSQVPILCVSSYTEGRERELIEAGFNEVFSKSSFINSFGPTLEKYLGE